MIINQATDLLTDLFNFNFSFFSFILIFGKYVLKEKDNSVSLNIGELKTKINIVEFKEKKPHAFRSYLVQDVVKLNTLS